MHAYFKPLGPDDTVWLIQTDLFYCTENHSLILGEYVTERATRYSWSYTGPALQSIYVAEEGKRLPWKHPPDVQAN